MTIDTESQLTGRRIVLTGAAGFIGGHVLRRLATTGAGYVAAVDTRPLPEHVGSAVDGRIVAVHHRSVLEPLDDVLSGADVVIHLAAQVSPPRSVTDPLADATANAMGTLALLESMRRASVRRLIYASSSAVYGTPRYLPVDEAHPTQPDSPYGLSKLTGENYAFLYGRLHHLSVVSLRFFNVFGLHQPLNGGYAGVIRLFLDWVSRGEPLTIEGDGSHTRDFVHVDDVVRAVVAAASSSYEGALNVGSGVGISIARLAAIVGGAGYPIRSVAPRLGDIPHSVAAVEAARSAIGFDAIVSLQEGLAEMRRKDGPLP